MEHSKDMKTKITKCPICMSKNTDYYLKALETHGSEESGTDKYFTYNKCNNCDCIFLVEEKFNNTYYKKYYGTNYRKIKNSSLKQLEKLVTDLSNKIKRQTIYKLSQPKKHISLLDIGTGNAMFLRSFPENTRYHLFGTEIYNANNKNTRYKIFKKDLSEKLSLNFGTFDVITMWHVLEHITNPHQLFKNIYTLLNSQGALVFSIPSPQSLGLKEGKHLWFHLDAPRHVIFYSPKTVQFLADKYHFKLLRVKNNWYDFPTDLYHSLRNNRNKLWYYAFYPFYKYKSKETLTYILIKR